MRVCLRTSRKKYANGNKLNKTAALLYIEKVHNVDVTAAKGMEADSPCYKICKICFLVDAVRITSVFAYIVIGSTAMDMQPAAKHIVHRTISKA